MKVKEEPAIDILDFIDSNENSMFLDEMPPLPTLTSDEINSIIPSFTNTNDNDILDSLFEFKPKIELPIEETEFSEARVIEIKNYQEEPADSSLELNIKHEIHSDIDMQDDDVNEEIPYEEKYVCKKSLFNSKPVSEKYPWERDLSVEQEDVDDFVGDKTIELIGEYEEREIYKRLKTIFERSHSQAIDIPAWIRRHYRKLNVRMMQRSLGLPVFNVDKLNKGAMKKEPTTPAVLDRFHQLISTSGNFATGKKTNESFMSRLAGFCQYDLFVSPYTERVLHPFIYRDNSCVPPWAKLMCELKYKVNGTVPSRASIDYCYVRPQHIAAVNGLLQRMFWPGIDSK